MRHPPAAIAPGVCYGRLDLDVADPADIQRLAARLGEHRGRVWTSPARRCRLVAQALGPHAVDPALHELDFGAWEGCPWDGIPRPALDRWAADPMGSAPSGGETGASLVARIVAFMARLPTGDHVIITHGGPLKVLRPLLEGAPIDLFAPPPPPGAIIWIQTASIASNAAHSAACSVAPSTSPV